MNTIVHIKHLSATNLRSVKSKMIKLNLEQVITTGDVGTEM